eukprot:gene5643-5602_t
MPNAPAQLTGPLHVLSTHRPPVRAKMLAAPDPPDGGPLRTRPADLADVRHSAILLSPLHAEAGSVPSSCSDDESTLCRRVQQYEDDQALALRLQRELFQPNLASAATADGLQGSVVSGGQVCGTISPPRSKLSLAKVIPVQQPDGLLQPGLTGHLTPLSSSVDSEDHCMRSCLQTPATLSCVTNPAFSRPASGWRTEYLWTPNTAHSRSRGDSIASEDFDEVLRSAYPLVDC